MQSPVGEPVDVSSGYNQPLSIRMFSNVNSHKKLINSFDKDDGRKIKRYRKWKGKNIFLCGGKIMLGVHSAHLLSTVGLIFLSWTQYIMLIAPFLHWHKLYLAATVLFFANFVFLFSVACKDPGILPRQHFRNEKSASTGIIRKDAAALKTQFCKICNIWRPSRARHCKYCDNCVDVFDHHCPWTGTCIGMRNYPQFFLFVSSVLVSALFVLAGALYLLLGWVLAGASTDMPILRIIALGTTIPWCCVVLFLVTTLLGFHVYLIYNGLTTNEYFRKKRAQRRISMTPPAPTEHNNHNRGGVWYCWTLPWASATTNNNTTSSRQVTTSDDVYNSITTSAEGEDLPTVTSPGGENLTTEAGGLQLELNNLNYPTPTHPTQTAQEGNGGAKYSAGERMLRATADLMLTPLFDAEATPFPHLSPGASPSPSPLSPQYSPELRHPYREPPRGVLPGDAAAGGGNSTNDASNFESGTDPAYSSQRAEIPSSDRIIKLYNHRPTLTLTLPPIEEVKSESDNGFLSAELSQAARTQDSAVATVRTVALKDVLQRRGCCVSCTAVVCLPCLVVKHCGRPATYDGDRVRASTGAHTNDNNSPPYRPNSPSGSVKGDRNERYTYAYFCGCVPIVPHSRLLPLWQYEDERDTQQQEEMLEVLFDQLRVALRREALDSSADFSV